MKAQGLCWPRLTWVWCRVQYHAHGQDQPAVEIDFTPPWPRVPIMDGLAKALGKSLPEDVESEEMRQFLIQQVTMRLTSEVGGL